MGATYTRSTPCPREFRCRMCGADVLVEDRRDHRTVFCCERCEKRFWKHASRYQMRKKIARGHVTYLEREHRENRREAGFER